MQTKEIGHATYSSVMDQNVFTESHPLPFDILLDCLPEFDATKLKLVIFNTPAKDYTSVPNRGRLSQRRPPIGEYLLQSSLDQTLGEGTAIVADLDRYNLTPTDTAELMNGLNKITGHNITAGLNMFSPNRYAAFETASAIRKRCSDSLIIFGGRGTTIERGSIVKEFSKDDKQTIAVLGEAELLLPQILQSGWIGRDEVVTTDSADHRTVLWLTRAQLENLPLAKAPPYQATQGAGNHYYTGLSSRSCPHNCNFCAASQDTPYRQYSIGYLKRQLEEVPRDGQSPVHFEWNDDNVWVNATRAKQMLDIFDRLSVQNGKFVWRLLTRGDVIIKAEEEGLLAHAHDLGLEEIAIGVESRDADVLLSMNKGETPELIDEAIKLALQQGIRVKAFTMIGYPNETLGQMERTLHWLKEMKKKHRQNFRHSLFVAAPYKGTNLYTRLLEDSFSPWSLQLYTEAASTGSKRLIDEVDRLGIQIATLSLGKLMQIVKDTEVDLDAIKE